MTEIKKLSILPSGESRMFSSSLDEKMVRTGCFGEGDCFFHAILHSISQEYRTGTVELKQKLVKAFRKELKNELMIEEFLELGNSTFISLQEKIRELLEQYESYIKKGGQNPLEDEIGDEYNSIYGVIFEILPIKIFFPKVCDKMNQTENISKTKKIFGNELKTLFLDRIKDLEKEEGETIEESRIVYWCDRIKVLAHLIYDLSLTNAYKEFRTKLGTVGIWMDVFVLKYISNKIDRDIYFLDGDRKPLKKSCELKGRKSVILLWIDESHFEVIGRLLEDKRIQREFEPDDKLIVKMGV